MLYIESASTSARDLHGTGSSKLLSVKTVPVNGTVCWSRRARHPRQAACDTKLA